MPWSAALTQAVVNGLIGILAFQIVESGPGLMQRRRARGATLSRRQSSRALSRLTVRRRPLSLPPDDRRNLSLRLSALQAVVATVLCRAGGRVLGLPGRRSTRSSRRWPRTTTSAGCRCRRRAACCSIATARCSSRIGTPSISRSCASSPATSTRRCARWRPRPGADEAQLRDTVNRRRREPSYRPIVLIENATPEQVDRRPARASGSCPASSTRKCRRASIRRATWRRISSATSARSARTHLHADGVRGRRIRLDRRQGGRRAGVQQAADGQGRRQDWSSSTAAAARWARSSEDEPVEGDATPADDRRRRPEGRPKTAFDASGFNGAAVVLDPRDGEVLAFTSRPAYDPNAFAGGIDRATWAALNSDELKPLQNRALQGRYSPGSTFKMAVGLAGTRRGHHHAGLHACTAPAARTFYGRYFRLLEEGRPRCGRPAPRDRAVLRRLLLHGRQHARRRSDQQVGDALRPRRASRTSICRTSCKGSCRRRSGRRRPREPKWYPGETISVSIGQGQVSGHAHLDGGLRRRRSPTAAPASRRTCVKAIDDGQGWKPVPAPPPQSTVEVTPEKLQAIRDGMWMRRQRRRARAAGRGSRAQTSAARPARRR